MFDPGELKKNIKKYKKSFTNIKHCDIITLPLLGIFVCTNIFSGSGILKEVGFQYVIKS